MANYFMGGSFVGFRVQDENSATRYNDGRGFRAREMDPDISFEYNSRKEHCILVEYVLSHLDWSSTERSPFISVYEHWEPALREAMRRVNCGLSKVRIYEITVPAQPRGHRERIEYRRVPRLLEGLGVDMPRQVGSNAEHEVLFLGKIPRDCVELVPEGEWMES